MRIAVYCSAKDKIPEEYLALGDKLGQWMASAGQTLVYGGATGGLMTRVSQAVKQHGGEVIGVISQRIVEANRQATNCDELYSVQTLNERKQQMKDLADCFVCLPGSYGTIDEMMDVIASGTVGEHRKPIFVLNYQGYYEGLKQQADHMRQLGFLPPVEQFAPVFVDTLDELISQLTSIIHKNK